VRITIVQGAFLPVPPIRGGAVEKLWFQLGQLFHEFDHRVVHISRRFPGLPCKQALNGVNHVRVSGFNAVSNLVLYKALDLLYSIRVLFSLPSADIVVSNTFWLPILLSRFFHSRGRIIVSVERMPKGQMFLYRRVAMLRCCSMAVRDRVVSESPQLASKTLVIPNPLPFSPDHLLPSFTKEKIILYCGRLHPEKGLDLLLKAFDQACSYGLSDWSLRLVGPSDIASGGGGGVWFRRLHAIASACNGVVQLIGPIFDDQKLHAEYQKASIFAYPSLSESGEAMGLAPLEAMAFGAVPLVSSLACFGDFIIHGFNGVVFDHRSHDPVSALALALLGLASDPLRLQRLSREALQVRQTHHPRRIAQQMLDCFNQVCFSDTNVVL